MTSKGQQPWGIGIDCTSITILGPLVLRFEVALKRVLQNGPRTTSENEHGRPWLVIYPGGAQEMVYNTETRTWEALGAGYDAPATRFWDEEIAQIVDPTGREVVGKAYLLAVAARRPQRASFDCAKDCRTGSQSG